MWFDALKQRHVAVTDGILQSEAVDVFEDDGIAVSGDFLKAYGMADVRVVKLQSYFKLLTQCVYVGRHKLKLWFEALEHVAFAVACGTEKVGISRW